MTKHEILHNYLLKKKIAFKYKKVEYKNFKKLL